MQSYDQIYPLKNYKRLHLKSSQLMKERTTRLISKQTLRKKLFDSIFKAGIQLHIIPGKVSIVILMICSLQDSRQKAMEKNQ